MYLLFLNDFLHLPYLLYMIFASPWHRRTKSISVVVVKAPPHLITVIIDEFYFIFFQISVPIGQRTAPKTKAMLPYID
jgi:hypothetical protein